MEFGNTPVSDQHQYWTKDFKFYGLVEELKAGQNRFYITMVNNSPADLTIPELPLIRYVSDVKDEVKPDALILLLSVFVHCSTLHLRRSEAEKALI